MFLPSEYELLDFGVGRKLERFGPLILDRPSPAAEDAALAHPALWGTATARFERLTGDQGSWIPQPAHGKSALLENWTITHGTSKFLLKPTDFGHVGIFPEQQENWDWLAETIPQFGRQLKVLNLFAYTGGSTLACAAAGASVVHVDAARNVVDWARENAALSGLSSAPIRWITEDALKFAQREVRRGNHYEAVIMDPPSYGHGPKGEVWKIDEHLPELLDLCGKLTSYQPAFLLATCHSANWDARRLGAELLQRCLRSNSQNFLFESADLSLSTVLQEQVPSGVVTRISHSDENCS